MFKLLKVAALIMFVGIPALLVGREANAGTIIQFGNTCDGPGRFVGPEAAIETKNNTGRSQNKTWKYSTPECVDAEHDVGRGVEIDTKYINQNIFAKYNPSVAHVLATANDQGCGPPWSCFGVHFTELKPSRVCYEAMVVGGDTGQRLKTHYQPCLSIKFTKFTINVSIEGKGHVTTLPHKSDCQNACTNEFERNEQAILTAVADEAWKFVQWEGDKACMVDKNEPAINVVPWDKVIIHCKVRFSPK